jgi:threonine synthase
VYNARFSIQQAWSSVMRYVSTRGGTPPMSFTQAVVTGLAPDGGLLIPQDIPDVRPQLEQWRELGFVDLAKQLLRHFVDDIPYDTLDELIDRAYASFTHPDIVPFAPLPDSAPIKVLELFHGPTLAFKDVALQLLGQLFEYVLERDGQHLNILGATSGDTGGAAIAGVRGLPAVDIFIMYPYGKVSPLQELQMTTVLDDNVHCLCVDGSFDDCQNLMKTIFNDSAFKAQYSLGAVNSVNWARVLAQIVYYGYASLRAGDGAAASFCVPTGNFGNVFAGYLAKRMGFPIDKLILATNDNDILSVFFNTGRYQRGDVHFTISPAMDIQVASNFERFLYYHFQGDSLRLCGFMESFAESGAASVDELPSADDFLATAVTQDQTLEAIARMYREYGYVVDPHTAVGIVAAERFDTDGPKICIATAHPAKFPESVDKVTHGAQTHHPTLDALVDLPSRSTRVAADPEAIKAIIAENARENR